MGSSPGGVMDKEAEAALRRELEAKGEAQVSTEFWGTGGLTNGDDKERRWVIRQWLREKEKRRNLISTLVQWIAAAVFVALFALALDLISEISERYELACEGASVPCKPIDAKLTLLYWYAFAGALGVSALVYFYWRPKK